MKVEANRKKINRFLNQHWEYMEAATRPTFSLIVFKEAPNLDFRMDASGLDRKLRADWAKFEKSDSIKFPESKEVPNANTH